MIPRAMTARPAFDLSLGLASRTPLSHGTRMPVFGLGVWKMGSGAPARKAIRYALEVGYRLIDTAALYGNEAEVGEAVRESGVSRDEVFITTKLWNDDQGYETALRAFERSHKRLGLGVVDLYLIHWPMPERRGDSWRALERLQREGKCREIGVSNYTVAHLEELARSSSVVPAVNQVEFSPFLYQRELLDYCRRQGVQLEAYAPLTRGHRLGDPVISEIARAHSRTAAQVALRWGLQHDVVVIPKSIRPERIRENADVFGFSVSPAELARLDGLTQGFRTTWNPDPVV